MITEKSSKLLERSARKHIFYGNNNNNNSNLNEGDEMQYTQMKEKVRKQMCASSVKYGLEFIKQNISQKHFGCCCGTDSTSLAGP